MKEHKLIVIVGPTAVGKTAVAIEVAERLKTEIISADSRQIYKELTIGTAKPDEAELQRVPHHFINSHSIQEDYDAASYSREALALIHQLFETHMHLVLCGGSGLYVKAVLEGFDDIPDVPDEIREQLTENFERHGIAWLQEQMRQLDPEHFATLDQQNPHRLMRALEVKIGTGQSIASFRRQAKLEHPFQVIKIGLELPREVLYKRIDDRMDQMIAAGLFEEAQQLYPYRNHNALQTVGYQEIFNYIDNQYDREEAIRLLKRNSRRYAKRQLTWFKRDEETVWMNPQDIQAILNLIN
ncbi:MAG TPA: tRNA (adenosine(37)-N6)-dimethylallyltransferase MiaA [Ohtaekwangia sp.]|uniref:tRNA (adenosine(37)-N6)-dimethylallyltransferase MiaA n=1 Tax=Ohtaekwangia sp. TaxID=2066019 RepID=UPI002F937731